MINNLSYKDILERLKEKGLNEEELENKIEEKINQLSGLVSREGAAHIIANELGVKVFEEVGEIKINEARNGMRNVNMNGKVTMIFGIREFKTEKREGRVGSFLMGDETGTIRMVLWDNAHLELMDKSIKEDIIIRVENGYIKENRGYKEIHLSNHSVLKVEPEGVEIKEIKISPIINIEKQISNLNEEDKNVSLKGTIVQIFDPRFFEVCPECRKRANMENGIFKCGLHGQVMPSYGAVISAVLDDGSESIRIVCFREQVGKLLGIEQEEVLKLKDNPGEIEPLKEGALGKQIKANGRVNKNEMFERLEFVISDMEDLKPESLLKEYEI